MTNAEQLRRRAQACLARAQEVGSPGDAAQLRQIAQLLSEQAEQENNPRRPLGDVQRRAPLEF